MRNVEKYPKSRPSAGYIENILDEQDDKVQHYFRLYSVEKKKKIKLEQYNYWLQHELKNYQSERDRLENYIEKLEHKFEIIRNGPNNLVDQIQRLDLIYLQLDTLVQSLAGICNKVYFEKPSQEAVGQIVLDYLFPCRALDERLNTLYGLIYYNKIGEPAAKFDTPPVPPTPLTMLTDDASSPWINTRLPGQSSLTTSTPSAYSLVEKTVPKTSSSFSKGEDASNSEKAITKPKETAFKTSVSVTPPKSEVTKTTTKKVDFNQTKTESKQGSKPEIRQEQKRESSSEFKTESKAGSDVVETASVKPLSLRGFKIGVHKIEQFKRPSSSLNKDLCCVARYDFENAQQCFGNPSRRTKTSQGKVVLGKEKAEIDQTIEIGTLPEKVKGVLPKFIIDVYDGDSLPATIMGSVSISFDDAKYLKENQDWEIKDSSNTTIGFTSLTIKSIPETARLPAQVILDKQKERSGEMVTDKAPSKEQKPENQEKIEESSSVEAKKAPIIKKPLIQKPMAPVKKDEVPAKKEALAEKEETPVKKDEVPPPASKVSEKSSIPESKEEPASPKTDAEDNKSRKSSIDIAVPELKVPPLKKPGLGSPVKQIQIKATGESKVSEGDNKDIEKASEPSSPPKKKFQPKIVGKKGPTSAKKEIPSSMSGAADEEVKKDLDEKDETESKAGTEISKKETKVVLKKKVLKTSEPPQAKKVSASEDELNDKVGKDELSARVIPKLGVKVPGVEPLSDQPKDLPPPIIIKKPVLPVIKKPDLSKKLLIKKPLLLPKIS